MRGSLRRTLYAVHASWALASQDSLPPPSRSLPPPWHAPWDCANSCCFQCLPHAVVMLHCAGGSRGLGWLRHLHSITLPHSGFIVNLSDHLLRGPAVVLFVPNWLLTMCYLTCMVKQPVCISQNAYSFNFQTLETSCTLSPTHSKNKHQ